MWTPAQLADIARCRRRCLGLQIFRCHRGRTFGTRIVDAAPLRDPMKRSVGRGLVLALLPARTSPAGSRRQVVKSLERDDGHRAESGGTDRPDWLQSPRYGVPIICGTTTFRDSQLRRSSLGGVFAIRWCALDDQPALRSRCLTDPPGDRVTPSGAIVVSRCSEGPLSCSVTRCSEAGLTPSESGLIVRPRDAVDDATARGASLLAEPAAPTRCSPKLTAATSIFGSLLDAATGPRGDPPVETPAFVRSYGRGG